MVRLLSFVLLSFIAIAPLSVIASISSASTADASMADAVTVDPTSIADRSPQLIVRQPRHSSMGYSRFGTSSAQGETSNYQVLRFKNHQERIAYEQSLERGGIEFEAPVVYRSDAVELNDLQLLEMREASVKADPMLSSQWSLFPVFKDERRFEGVDIDAMRAWTVVKSAPKVVMYIVDSGVNDSHEDLKGRVVGFYNAFDSSKPAEDDNGHGTHVASIAAARGDNKIGMTGLVPGDIQIVAVKFLGSKSSGDTTVALRAFEWIEQDIDSRWAEDRDLRFIVSNSWGGGYSRFLEEVFQRLADRGVLLITSAGNHSKNNDVDGYFPCNFKATGNLCVGATDISDNYASFSGYGVQSVHLAAPGVQILGLVPAEGQSQGCAGEFCRKNGTSQAVPHVSGVAALVWAANPSLSHRGVHEVLVNSVDRLPNLEDKVMSGGRLNAYRAVLMATGSDISQADRPLAAKEASSAGGGCSLGASPSNSAATLAMFLPILWVLLMIRRRAKAHDSTRY